MNRFSLSVGNNNKVVRVYEKANFEVFAEWVQIIRC